ncbi:TM1812 family CRISPR-associated protein [Tardisphaera miroshnichenkoae]
MKILISTWGSPWADPASDPESLEGVRWQEVSYKVQGASDKAYRSRTTAIPLIEELKPDLVLILGTDTVAAPPDGSENYEELLKAAEKRYRAFLESSYKVAGLAPRPNVQVAVIPFPGKFQFSSSGNSAKWSLRSEVDPSDMRAFLLWELTKAIYTAIEGASEALQSHEKITIAVDTSHGFNVVPVLAYSIVRELAGVLSLIYDVEVQEFNSAPVVGDLSSKGLEEVNIMLVDSYKSKQFSGLSFHRPEAVLNDGLLRGINIGSESLRGSDPQLWKPLCEISKDDLLAFVAGTAYAFPLAVYHFFPDHRALFECGNAIIKKWINDSRVAREESEVTVYHEDTLSEDFDLLAYSMLISRLLSQIKVQRKDRINKSDVELLRKKVYSANPLWDHILSSTETEIFEKHEIEKPRKSDPDIRNFIAHSGLTWELIQVTQENGETHAAYLAEKLYYVKKMTKKLYDRYDRSRVERRTAESLRSSR